MQRREFSISAVAATAAGSSLLLPSLAQAQAAAPKEGSDYLALDRPAPTEAPAGKVEVVEFFWYNCPHCNSFEPQLATWLGKMSKNVSFRRAPIAFRPDFGPQQRLYYVLESMNRLGDLHAKVFYAIHAEKQTLNNAEQIANWIAKQGVDKAKFMQAYESFPVVTKVRKAVQLQEAYKVDGVPALGIAGKYYTSGSQAKSMERALAVVDHLVGLQAKA
jgi:thiol:disulfide interchange protein DsbA